MNSYKPLVLNNFKKLKSCDPESLNLTNDNDNGVIIAGDPDYLQLQQMVDQNTHLKDQVDKLNNKISNIVDSNSKFISIISHDLRNPFNSILGILEILKKNLNKYDIAETNHLIDLAADSTNKTLDLLNSLLIWAASQSETNSFNPVKTNLYELIEEEIDSVKGSYILKNISFHHSIAPDLNVRADPQMVKTIVRNLINNSIKYTPNGGEIYIKASVKEPYIEIAVRDNGVGISREAQSNLFNKGVNSKNGTNNETGTGLGLLISKEFVDKHGGNILVESGDGKGSEFKFTLPRHS